MRIRNFISLILIVLTLMPSAALPQKRVNASANKSSQSSSKCSGAWTGTIAYKRTQSKSDSKTVARVSGRGEDKTDWQMSYTYNARVAVIESPERIGSSRGKASIIHSFYSNETVVAKEKNSCDRGKTWREMTGTSRSRTETSGSESNVDANVTVGVNQDGTYTVGVALPQIRGKVQGSQSSTFSGQCTPKEGKDLKSPPTETSIDGNSLTSDGTDRINPSDPNRLSGSYTSTWQNVTETITWNLQKCGAPLRLTDVAFEDMKFPNWNDWGEITEQKGTIDGNLVKIKAKILNASGETKYADVKFKETYKGDKWDGARPDGLLQNGEVSIRLEPGEEREVEMVWDSSGYSWFDDGRPRLVQRIKAELEENGKKVDEMTKNLKVAPKPLVLVHGLWSNWKAWETWQNILTTSHSYDWKAFPVGEKPDKGLMNTGGGFLSTERTNSIFENSQQLGKYIRYAQEDRNAWHVDVVAHSMGGLISRHYINQFMPPTEDGRPQIAHLIMLGTPNMGSPCADVMDTAFQVLGKDVEAVRQLRQDVAAEFNRANRNRKGVKFSALAGDPLPNMCKTIVWNDGVVSVPSAKWEVADNATSKRLHTDLTGTEDFSAFVKPRLAVGPKGDHNPEVPQRAAISPRNYGAAYLNAAWNPEGSFFAPPDTTTFAKAVKVPAGGSVEVEIPAAAAANLGVTFMADPKMSATLFDPAGVKRGENLTGTSASFGWFRSIFVDKNITPGMWKMVLKNTSDREAEVVLTAWNALQ
jgi:pimeloyl-ACP methyl ester carboxylesterase